LQTSNSDSLKILFLAKSSPVYGGVERWLADLISGLESYGHVCVVALARGPIFHDPCAYRKAYPSLRTVELDGLTGSPVGRQMSVKKALLQEKPDIVMPIMLSDGLEVSAYLKQNLAYKLVYPVHEIGQGVTNDLRRYSEFIDSIVFVDQSSERHYLKVLADESRSLVLPCGVREHVHNRVESRNLRIGFCGRLVGQKRVLDLIPLCEALDKVEQLFSLTIVGAGEDLNTLQAGLSNRINSDANNTSEVRILSPVDRDQLYEQFYNNIDILIITSEWETGPLVAFEAMMNNVVVVTSNFSGRSENGCLLDEENCLVFPIGDMTKAADQIQRLTQDSDLNARLVGSAYKYASRQRSLKTMCDSWLQLFLSLQTEKKPPSTKEHLYVVASLPVNSRLQRAKEYIRRLFRLKYLHKSAGEEWPYFYSSTNKH